MATEGPLSLDLQRESVCPAPALWPWAGRLEGVTCGPSASEAKATHWSQGWDGRRQCIQAAGQRKVPGANAGGHSRQGLQPVQRLG